MHMIEQTPKEDAGSAPGCSDTDEDSDVDELSWGTHGCDVFDVISFSTCRSESPNDSVELLDETLQELAQERTLAIPSLPWRAAKGVQRTLHHWAAHRGHSAAPQLLFAFQPGMALLLLDPLRHVADSRLHPLRVRGTSLDDPPDTLACGPA